MKKILSLIIREARHNYKRIICFMIILIIMLIIKSYNSKQIKGINQQDWALNNSGQTINNIKGLKGLDIGITKAWNISQGSENIIVGVVDSGIDISLASLKNNILYNENDPIDGIDNDKNGYIDDYCGWDFYNNDYGIYDDYNYDYHGTYVATTLIKVAPNIKILPVKFLKSTIGSAKDATAAIEYAIKRGARIINCSWSFNVYDNELYEIMKNNSNVLFVCAAGNGNINLDEQKIYPCSYDLNNIITVMAVSNNGEIYRASGYGNNVDIAAPGVNVLVEFPEGDITFIDGTSVATAFVSSAASLILSVDDTLTPDEVKNIIIISSKKLDNLKSKCYSGGFLDIYNSLMKVNTN